MVGLPVASCEDDDVEDLAELCLTTRLRFSVVKDDRQQDLEAITKYLVRLARCDSSFTAYNFILMCKKKVLVLVNGIWKGFNKIYNSLNKLINKIQIFYLTIFKVSSFRNK